LLDAVALVDDVVLVDGIGMGTRTLQAVRRDHADLASRRLARAKGD
jgi:hypothetical protein